MTKKNKYIKVVAHRGASSLAPENTLVSFRKAREFGAKAIELDVHLSADGALVVHHDYFLGHPDNGSGLIRKTALDKIKQVDAGSWFSSQFLEEKIPILEEVFAEFDNTFDYEIELKGTTMEFLDKVLNLVGKYNLINHIEFTSPHLVLLCRLKHLRKDVKCGIFFSEYPKWMSADLGELIIVDTMKLVAAEVAHIPSSILAKNLVKSLHANGFLVHVADCNTQEKIIQAIDHGCDQFSTNELLLAHKVIESYFQI